MKILIFLFVLSLACPLLAQSTLSPHRRDDNNDSNGVGSFGISRFGSDETLIYSEKGGWVYERFRYPGENRLPIKIERAFFANRKDLLSKQPLAREMDIRDSQVWTFFPSEDSRFVTESSEVIWKSENSWSWEWEEKFSEWSRREIKSDFFEKYKIATDCADIAYAIRWIFARIHKLPAANRLASGRILFTNESMKKQWEKLPTNEVWHKDQRFLTALNYLMEFTFTHVLNEDSYPIEIRPGVLLEGTHHLQLRKETGHTLFVNEVNLDQSVERLPIHVVYSNVPKQIRTLYTEAYHRQELLAREVGGFLRFRWPEKTNDQWKLRKPQNMPHYSLEQYEESFVQGHFDFTTAVYKRLNPLYDPLLRVKEGIRQIWESLEQRRRVVEDGFAFCQTADCSRGSANYENWSTPSRDRALKDLIFGLGSYVENTNLSNPEIGVSWENFLKDKFTIFEKEFTAGHIVFVFGLHMFSSEPQEPLEKRWGLTGVGFLLNAKERLTPLIDQRKEKISANECRLSDDSNSDYCLITSEAYRNSQSFGLDREIRQTAAGFSKYCQHAPPRECQSLQKNLEHISIGFPNPVKFQEFQERVLFMNSDPRWPNFQRWGGESKNWKTFAHNSFLFVEAKGFLLSGDKIFRLSDGKLVSDKLVLPEMNYHNAWVASLDLEQGQIQIFDPASGRLWRVPYTHSIIDLKWGGSNTLVVISSEGGEIYWVDENRLEQRKLVKNFLLPERDFASFLTESVMTLNLKTTGFSYIRLNDPKFEEHEVVPALRLPLNELPRYVSSVGEDLIFGNFSMSFSWSPRETKEYGQGLYALPLEGYFISQSGVVNLLKPEEGLIAKGVWGRAGSRYLRSEKDYMHLSDDGLQFFPRSEHESVNVGQGPLAVFSRGDGAEVRDIRGRVHLKAEHIISLAQGPSPFFQVSYAPGDIGIIDATSGEPRPLLTGWSSLMISIQKEGDELSDHLLAYSDFGSVLFIKKSH